MGKKISLEETECNPVYDSRGERRLLVNEKTCGSKLIHFGRYIVAPNTRATKHLHTNAEEVIYIISGHGTETSGDETFNIGPGDAIFIPKGEVHQLQNTSLLEPMEFVVAYGGAGTLEKTGAKAVKE